jgi:hypothetical protein
LNVHRISDVRQREIHTAEPLVPGPSTFEVEIAIAKLKIYQSPGSSQIPAQTFQTRGEILRSEIHKLINSILNKEELSDQWKCFVVVQIYKKGDKTPAVIIVGYHCYQPHTKCYPTFFSQVYVHIPS